jgi:nucleotide-binding universal stress UspA family protein
VNGTIPALNISKKEHMYKILVPYDFSETSKKALQHAGVIAAKKNGKVHVLHVVETGQNSSFHTQGYAPQDPAFEIAVVRMVKKLKERLNAEIPTLINMEFLGKAEVKSAQFDSTIPDMIIRQEADLIVMGTEGFEGSKELIISSTTQRVADACNVPLIVVKKDTPYSDYSQVVYASHFDETHADEMTQFAQFLDNLEAKLDLVKVNGDQPLEEGFLDRLNGVAHSLQFNEANAKAEVVRSKEVEEAIQLYVEKQRANLLTVNAHDVGGLGRFFGDHTVEHLVNQTKQPIMLLNVS